MAEVKVKTTALVSGDSNNKIFRTYYESHPEKAEGILQALMIDKNHSEAYLADIIFSETIGPDSFRQMTSALTLYDEFRERTGVEFTMASPNDYYFALVVNKLVADGAKAARPECRITSFQQLSDIRKIFGSSKKLDYAEYIIGGDHSKQKIKYIKCPITLKFLSSNAELKIPVKKNLFGATFRIDGGSGKNSGTKYPAVLTFEDDPNAKEYIVPHAIWYKWIKDRVEQRPTPNFLAAETGLLKFYLKPDSKGFTQIMDFNGVKKALDVVNSYEYEINQFHELVFKCPPDCLTDLIEDPDECGFGWEDHGERRHVLKNRRGGFYIVNADENSDALVVYTG